MKLADNETFYLWRLLASISISVEKELPKDKKNAKGLIKIKIKLFNSYVCYFCSY